MSLDRELVAADREQRMRDDDREGHSVASRKCTDGSKFGR